MFNTLQNSNFDILIDEQIGYNQSIIISSLFPTEIFHYSRQFVTNKNYKLCTVKLNIPYTTTKGFRTIARVLLYLDNDMIYDGTIFSEQSNIIRPMNFNGHKSNLNFGQHSLKLMACVNSGELHIPHLNKTGQEFLIQPPISGSLLIIGYN